MAGKNIGAPNLNHPSLINRDGFHNLSIMVPTIGGQKEFLEEVIEWSMCGSVGSKLWTSPI